MNLETEKAINENTADLRQLYYDGLVTYDELRELHKEAVNEREYEVAVSIRDILNEILISNK